MGWASRPSFLNGRDAHPTITIKIVSYLIRDPKGAIVDDNKNERWDQASVHEFRGTYGDYVLNKVAKVFPQLRQEVL